MRRFNAWRPLTLGLVGSLLAFAPAGRLAAADPRPRVVVMSIDGLAAYLLDDPNAPLPTIRQLAREGSFVAGGMTVSNPSVTWPNHTTMVTGVRPAKHGVLANGVLVRGGVGAPVLVDPRQDKDQLVRVPTLFDAAHAAGLSTADVNWPCTRGAASLDDSIPDAPDAVTHATPRFREELIAAGILADATDKTFMSASVVGRDRIWTEAACYLIRRRMPDLLLLHLLNVDATHHALGAQSPSGYTANAYADACVGSVLEALDEAGVRDQTTVFVVADHGFILTPKAIRPNVLLRQAGLLSPGLAGKVAEAQVHVISEGGIGLVYGTNPASLESDLQKAKELFLGQEGVAGVLEPAQFAEHGLPHPREYSQAPDLVLVAKEGYAVSASADGETFVATHAEGRVSLGSHGFLATEPKMNAVCVIAGRGVRPGVRLEGVENIDIAPTAARLLGLKGFEADGRVLQDALLDDKAPDKK